MRRTLTASSGEPMSKSVTRNRLSVWKFSSSRSSSKTASSSISCASSTITTLSRPAW